jgi:hypothetical protein
MGFLPQAPAVHESPHPASLREATFPEDGEGLRRAHAIPLTS